MATKVTVVGAGSWGTAMAALVARRVPTVLWARRRSLSEAISHDHLNAEYLPEIGLPESLGSTSDLEQALAGAEVVVMAVPSHGFRQVLSAARPFVPVGAPVISLSKGVEEGTLQRMTQVVADILPRSPVGVLTGPNLAREVMLGFPAASVVAMTDHSLAGELQSLLSTEMFRVYVNPDLIGCELAGALKNVVAIACGIADGLGFGDNTKAALMTRGLNELTRLGVALGGDALTFAGLAGMGDLVATCISGHSRNRHVGEQLGKGRALGEITAAMPMVAEGVRTSRAVVGLARRALVDVPICEEVAAALHEGKKATTIVTDLMQREVGPELHGIRSR